MARYVKYSSKEQGPWTSVDSKLITYDVPLADDIDHRKSYLILNMGVAASDNNVYNLMFGSKMFNVPLRSCALVQNSSLKSDRMASPLEYNQDVNLYMNNKKHYETGFTQQNAISFFQKSAHYDYKTSHPSTPFLDGVSYDAGDVAAEYKTGNVIIPLSDLYESFGNTILSKKVGSKLNYSFELDKTHNLFSVVEKCTGPINPIVCQNYVAGNLRLLTSTLTYNNKFLTELKNGDRIRINYTNGGVAKYQVAELAANGIAINAAGKLTLTTAADVWANGQAYTNISVSRAIEGVDFVLCDNLNAAGAMITSEGVYAENNNPFFVGQYVKVIFATQVGGAGAFDVYNIAFRVIEEIAFGPGPDVHLQLTLNANIPASQHIIVTGVGNSGNAQFTYNINKADLVLYQGDFGADLPKSYLALEQMPRNKLANTLIDETYILRPNTLLSYFMQGSATELVSYDPNLNNYRIYLDNKPTTEQNIVLNNSMSEDIKLRIYGPRLNNLDNDLNLDLNQRKVIVEETRGKNMLQLTMNAGVNGNMLGNILYMFSIVQKDMNM